MAAGNDAEHAAVCYCVLKECKKLMVPDVELNVGGYITDSSDKTKRIEAFRIDVVEPLFGYLHEQIDEQRMMLVLLTKYKHRCEWFRRHDLLKKCRAKTRQGENALLADFCEYLHEQGVEFHIEPKSASGRIDLISSQSGRDRLAADAKIFNPQRGQTTTYLAKGFRQVYDYTKDFNEPFGYLVVFKTCQQDLSIATAHQEFSVPFFTHNNKTIFFLVIDIFSYQKSASKRGHLKAYEITPEQLVESLGRRRGSTKARTGRNIRASNY